MAIWYQCGQLVTGSRIGASANLFLKESAIENAMKHFLAGKLT